MNEYDSLRMGKMLCALGYEPAAEWQEADLILINTCSVREKAEQKVYSLLGRLKRIKRARPSLLIGVAGCVAQKEGETLLERAPHLDFVMGTHAVPDLAAILSEVSHGKQRKSFTDFTYQWQDPIAKRVSGEARDRQIKSLITIMQGCDNFCTFCIVPYTRGRETSRPVRAIVRETARLLEEGTQEITLLGQNVNSYRSPDGEGGFVDLLEALNALDGLQRIRFTTSHPKDLSPRLISAFGTLEKLCPHIHLPVQSGSDRILRRMNRRYSVTQYLRQIRDLRAVQPDISITTDVIVGFPGETEDDFEQTLELFRRVRFDGAFSFKYSDRPPAKAAGFAGKIPEEIKAQRLQRLQALQDEITLERNRRFENRVEWVLVDRHSKKDPAQLSGRTPGNQVVNFSGGEHLIGRVVPVRIERALLHSLRGILARPSHKGESS